MSDGGTVVSYLTMVVRFVVDRSPDRRDDELEWRVRL